MARALPYIALVLIAVTLAQADEEAPNVKTKITSSSRFWGKRDSMKAKVGGSRIFWGKRSHPVYEELMNMDEQLEDSNRPSVTMEQVEPEFILPGPMHQRVVKANLPPKLAISSRFWGRR